MQRMLSFQMGRGFGESSEFVTKRMCFSFLFSVGFLCLLGGFLLGRFASDRTIVMHERRMLQELQGNGLQATKDLQIALLDILNASSFHEDFEMDSSVQNLRQQGVNGVKDIFADLSIFRLNVNETKTSTVATICGIQEQDRYVVLSASGEGFDVAITVAKTLDNIYRNKGWEPKRSLIFCVFLGSTDFCNEKFLNHIKPKIVAYIAVHGNAARGSDEIVVSGSGMVQATILDAMNEIKYYHKNLFKGVHSPNSLPRLNLDIPHAVLSFLNPNSTSQNIEQNQKILAQIVGLAMWRLSEEIFFQWDPKYFTEIMNKALTIIDLKELAESKENLNETVTMLTDSITNFNSDLEKINIMKSLDVRMANDKLIDLDRALLCSDLSLRSKTDFTKLKILLHEPAHVVKMNLNEICNCYKAANKILLDQAYCKMIFTDN
ncbi:PREDICTED: uncharacterized protein LOC105362890 [Ceratosolen solmsi marchali]|uniref:Uncharacterized protein LOC105362890 n=1 Tax=Ceratosolen solmsi marchali TaxID=326594 RepID=A0AAJ6YII5_9HYME|nr:PREDICTED: uncharacterized protein LOC105362890 [Ceratosolen solmsi marchali]